MKKDKGSGKYWVWGGVSLLLVVGVATYICMTNDQSENDLRFWLEVIVIGFVLSILSSVIVMIFFDKRDAKERQKKQAVVMRKLVGVVRTMANFLVNMKKKPEHPWERQYEMRTEKFITEIKIIEGNYLFELDKELLKLLEDVSLQPEGIEQYTPKAVKTLTADVEKIMKRIDTVTGKHNFHNLEELQGGSGNGV